MVLFDRKSTYRYLEVRNENYKKQVADLLQSLSKYSRRMAKLRDAGDNVSEAINTISTSEVLNPRYSRSVLI